jgi:hypothetical protein
VADFKKACLLNTCQSGKKSVVGDAH